MRSVLVPFALLVAAVSGLQILSPAEYAGNLESPIQNLKTSPNRTDGFLAELVFWPNEYNCPNQSIDPDYEGKVAVVDGKKLNLERIIETCRCTQLAGAIAIILSFNYPGQQSFVQRLIPDKESDCTIPALAVRESDWKPLLNELKAGNITAEALIEIDPNPWDDLWDSAVFIILLRVFVPAICITSIVVGLRAAYAHWETRKLLRGTKHDKILRWIIAALLLEAISGAIRSVYLIGGPLYCNGTFSNRQHSYLVTITAPFEVMTTLITVIVFKHWTAFGEKAFPKWLQVTFVLVGCAVFILETLAGNARDKLADGFLFTFIQAIIYVSVFLGTSVLFLYSGYNFYQTLAHSSDNVDKPRSMRKAVRWLMISGISELVVLAALIALGTGSESVFSPWGLFGCYFVVILSLSVLSFSHVFAFIPQRRKRSLDPNLANGPKSLDDHTEASKAKKFLPH